MTYDEIFAAIDGSAKVACSALIALYERQTADEQDGKITAHTNSRGFNGTDAPILSSFAQQVLRNRAIREAGGQTYGTDLSPRQLDVLRRKLRKYWRQLLEIAEEKAAARAAKANQGESPSPQVIPIIDESGPIRFYRVDAVKSTKHPGKQFPTTLPRTDDFDEFERIIHGMQDGNSQ